MGRTLILTFSQDGRRDKKGWRGLFVGVGFVLPIGVSIHIMWIGFVASVEGLVGKRDTDTTFDARGCGQWERINWP